MPKSYLVGLIGEGIELSLTPDLHMREAHHWGIDYEYRIIDVSDKSLRAKSFDWLLAKVVASGYDALNVTYPFKKKVIPYFDSVSQEVAQLGASNLILGLQSRLRGENTDWSGFEFALNNGLSEASREKVLQVGAGGAGSATAFALLKWGVEDLIVSDLDSGKSFELAEQLSSIFPNQKIRGSSIGEALELLPSMDGAVQATPMGMDLHPGVPFDISGLNPQAWVADVVYRPLETEFVKNARSAGHRLLTGSLMAIGQAVDSLRLITGIEPNVERMTAHFNELLGRESELTRKRGF